MRAVDAVAGDFDARPGTSCTIRSMNGITSTTSR